MKIQIISSDKSIHKNETENKENEYTFSELYSPKAFDAFDMNFINLQYNHLWSSNSSAVGSINSIQDFMTIKTLINETKKSKIIVCFPQNYSYYYNYYSDRFHYNCKLKDMMGAMIKIINFLIPNDISYKLMFENSKTSCNGEEIEADFCFYDLPSEYKELTKNIGAEHPTTVEINDKLIFTTLNLLTSYKKIGAFLSEIGFINHYTSIPKWIEEVSFYNDQEQSERIEIAKEQIEKSKAEIKRATDILSENMFYKRILFESGTPLVESVFKMLEKMLNYNLSSFVDNKQEDFKIILPDVTFIGEIKGINTNVKAENVSQLEVHCSEYSDQLEDEGRTESIKGILIINSQRSKPLKERETVSQKQINIAVRNGSLIVTSDVFLLLFEQFMLGKITTDQIKQIFKEKTGLLTHENFIPKE